MTSFFRSALALTLAAALAGCSVTSPAPSPAPPPPATAGAPAGLMKWPDLLGRQRPEPTASISYGEHQLQRVDVWVPAGPGPHPTVLMVHGGCWQTEIADRRIMNWIADDLRRRGIAVWNIDYRGVDREGGGYPGTFNDVSTAADLLAGTAGGNYNLDRRRIVAVGHSAGGHLALWLAGRRNLPKSSKVDSPSIGRGTLGMVVETPWMLHLNLRAVISLGGLPDLEQARTEEQGCGSEVIDRLVGPPTMSSRNVYADTSVPWLAPLGVRQVLVNGDKDRIIPTNFAGDYAAKMRAKGDKVDVRIVPNQGHVELIAPETAAWAVAVEEIERALGRRR